MGRDHFANYAKTNPKQYEAFSNSMWNGFVGITHTIGLGKFFSFTPDVLQDQDPEDITNNDPSSPK